MLRHAPLCLMCLHATMYQHVFFWIFCLFFYSAHIQLPLKSLSIMGDMGGEEKCAVALRGWLIWLIVFLLLIAPEALIEKYHSSKKLS